MKLTTSHMFFILLALLILCQVLGKCSLFEGMSGASAGSYSTQKGRNVLKTQGKMGLGVGPSTTGGGDYTAPSNITVTPSGQQVLATTQNTVLGIPKSQIPEGQSNLYILKSEVVPPVCPACPSSAVCPRDKPCPPCPPCARCPEPAFECKKVPNYQSGDNRYLPRPVLSDFSQFGM